MPNSETKPDYPKPRDKSFEFPTWGMAAGNEKPALRRDFGSSSNGLFTGMRLPIRSSRLLKWGIGIAVVLLVYFHYFRYTDFSGGCYIKLTPSLLEFSNLNIKRSLAVLKQASPTDYKNLCDNVDVINPNFSCGGFGGGCFSYTSANPKPRSIDVSTSKNDVAWTVSVLVHETCHAMQNHEGRPLSETECHEEGDRILRGIVQF